MAKLSAGKRKKMPKSEFAGPGKSFPVNDPEHARLAISGATRSEHAGNISKSTEAKIKVKARRKLSGGKSDEDGESGYARGGRMSAVEMEEAHRKGRCK